MILRKSLIRIPFVSGQPEGMGRGFVLNQLAEWLSLNVIETFTYEFHGLPLDELTPAERANEETWRSGGDDHGALFGSAWLKSP